SCIDTQCGMSCAPSSSHAWCVSSSARQSSISRCAADTTRLSSWTRAINVDRVLRRGSTSAPFRGRSRSEDLHLTEHVFGSQEKNPNFSCDARRPRRARPVADRLPDTMELHEAVPELEDVFARWAIVEHTPAIAWGLIHDGDL